MTNQKLPTRTNVRFAECVFSSLWPPVSTFWHLHPEFVEHVLRQSVPVHTESDDSCADKMEISPRLKKRRVNTRLHATCTISCTRDQCRQHPQQIAQHLDYSSWYKVLRQSCEQAVHGWMSPRARGTAFCIVIPREPQADQPRPRKEIVQTNGQLCCQKKRDSGTRDDRAQIKWSFGSSPNRTNLLFFFSNLLYTYSDRHLSCPLVV